MSETRETRIKRLYMRSIRRGIKEMDLILQSYAEAELDKMSDSELDLYEEFLSEIDHDLYQWVSGQQDTPAPYLPLIAQIRAGQHGVVDAGSRT